MMNDQLQVLIARMLGITDSNQKMNLLRSCADVGLTDPWKKEVRRVFKATREEEAAVPTHTYERVVESTELTLHKLDQVWPRTREGEVAVQAHTYERLTQLKLDTEATREVEMNKIRLKLDRMWPGTRKWEVAMKTLLKLDIEATREGEEAVPAHTYEQVVESTELTLHKLDQVWPGTREGEVAVQAHTYEQVVESTELTQLKRDTEATRDVEMYKAEGAGRRGINKDEGAGRQGMIEDGGAGRQDTKAPTDFYQAKTKRGDFYQYEDDRNVSTTAKLRKAGEEVITERHPQHKVKTKGKEEATGVVNGYKRPVLMDKEGKMKMEVKELREGAKQDKIYQKLKAAEKDRNFRQAQVAQIKAHNKNNGKVTGLFKGDEYTTNKTQCKEGAQVQGHRLDTNEELAELLGGRRRYGEEEKLSRHLDKTDIAEGDLEEEGRGREVQGQDNTMGKSEDEGAGQHGTNKAKGAGRQGMYEGAGRQG